MNLKKITFPKVKLPKLKMPNLKLPKVNLPKFNFPKVRFPKIELPKLSESKFFNKRSKKSKPFIDDVKSIFRSYRGQMIWISILSGFLLFLLNILIWVSMYGSTLNASLHDKLWMYFYLKDDVEDETKLYKQVMQLKDRLEYEWLKVNFLTKEDAMNFMMKRLPELNWSLEKFWMTNPLPATLYVTLPDISKYETLKEVMLENKDIIVNIQDVEQLEDLESQETRIKNVIRLSNFVQILSMGLIIILVATLLSFSIFFLRSIFNRFWNDMQVKKLLWATKSQIIMPFLTLILYSIIGGFWISLLLTLVSMWVFDYYMSQVFSYTLTAHLLPKLWIIIVLFIVEILVIVSLLMGISYGFVSKLHKKLK